MRSKILLPSVVALGVLTASPVWAVGGESGGVSVSGGVAGVVVAGAGGLMHAGHGVSASPSALAHSAPPEVGRDGASQVERTASDDSDGGLSQLLTGLALVLVLVGKRISG